MWKPGTPITIAADFTAEQLTSTIGNVKAIKFLQHWNNGQRFYWGDSTLDSTTNTGVIGYLAPPTAEVPEPQHIEEGGGANGVNCKELYVEGTMGEVVLWAYVEW